MKAFINEPSMKVMENGGNTTTNVTRCYKGYIHNFFEFFKAFRFFKAFKISSLTSFMALFSVLIRIILSIILLQALYTVSCILRYEVYSLEEPRLFHLQRSSESLQYNTTVVKLSIYKNLYKRRSCATSDGLEGLGAANTVTLTECARYIRS